MSEQNIENQRSVEPIKQNDEMEIDLMEILRKIVGIRKSLYKAAGIGLVIGIVVALSIPKQYTVSVKLSPEMGGNKSGNALAGLAASFLGSGTSGNDGADALNVSLSSDIVSSTPFLLELLVMNIPSSNVDTQIDLDSYLNEQSTPWWNYVIGIPDMLIGSMKAIFTDESNQNFEKKGERTIELTNEQSSKINLLRQNIKVKVDKKTAITNVSVTLQNPKITAIVADSVVSKLQEYIISYRTFKAKEDCAYLEKLFKERQQEYYTAQKKYADYVDSHDNLVLQSVRTEQERLQNDMNLAYQVYSQVANQLQVSRAKVQEEKPVFAVVEPAVVPQQPFGMGMKVYVMLFVFLSVVCTIGWVLIGKRLWMNLKHISKES